jgi:hypothetical protein
VEHLPSLASQYQKTSTTTEKKKKPNEERKEEGHQRWPNGSVVRVKVPAI